MITMHEKYGDGSDHEVCKDCSMCKDCGDCHCTENFKVKTLSTAYGEIVLFGKDGFPLLIKKETK